MGQKDRNWIGTIAILWAGMVIGGSLIAAPAKFGVKELSLPVALLVGRAQFGWLAVGELILVALGVGSLLRDYVARKEVCRLKLWLFLLAVVIFATQQGILMPQLQQRSALIISGEELEPGRLHLLYVVVECCKVGILCIVGTIRRHEGSGDLYRSQTDKQ